MPPVCPQCLRGGEVAFLGHRTFPFLQCQAGSMHVAQICPKLSWLLHLLTKWICCVDEGGKT